MLTSNLPKVIMHVLIVCSANMCRSPMAHAILEEMCLRYELPDLVVRSAGTIGYTGAPPVGNAREVCLEHDLSLDEFQSSALSPELIRQADCVLVMSDSHFRRVEALAKGQPLSGKVHYISEFHSDCQLPREIPDPVGRGIEHFRVCFGVLQDCLEGFLESVVSSR